MRIAVTGANGFVGRAIVDAASLQSHEVVSLVRTPSNLPNEKIISDLTNGPIHPSFLEATDTVIHLVARTHVTRESGADPITLYRDINVGGTRNILEAASAAGVKHFIYMSSVKAAGERTQPGEPLTEHSQPKPEDAYGITKLEAERLVQDFCEQNNMAWTIIRPPLVYGPGVEANFARLIKFVHQRKPLPLSGIANRRSIIFVDNLADATVKAMTQMAVRNKILMLCDKTLTTADLIRIIGDKLGKPARLFALPGFVFTAARAVPGLSPILDRLIGSLEIDPMPAMGLLNWTPPVDTSEAIRRTVDHWVSHQKDK